MSVRDSIRSSVPASSIVARGGEGRGGGGDSRFSSSAELRDLVLYWRLLVAIWAVVVACQNIPVHIAHADPVVALVLAPLDALSVSLDTGVDNVLRLALVAGCCEGG